MSGTVVVVYARSHSIGGLYIRHMDRFGKWSHCGIVTPENTVIEAMAFKGVIETPIQEFYARYDGRTELRNIWCPSPTNAVEFARKQLGKGYDYAGALGIAFRRKSWADDSNWQCSELVEAAVKEGGNQRFDEAPSIITPSLSYMVLSHVPH
jgi:uncharacterized protein YycO